MAYINGLRSFQKFQPATANKWTDALVKAEHAHLLCRKAAVLAQERMFEEAEEKAVGGISELKERLVVSSPQPFI